MEENIKILEEMKKDIVYDSDEDYDNQVAIRQIQAIENLIKGYRDSEDIMKNAVKENLELKEYIRELEEDNQKFESGKFLTPAQCVRIGKDYIPKSKVKEKIEELCKEIDKTIDNSKGGLDEEFINKGTELLAKKQVLQELMEDK